MSLTRFTRHLMGGIAGAVLIAAPAFAQSDRGTVQGVVNDASGKPVAGAFVKLKHDERRLTFMVITREQGQFEAKDLPPGQYRVQGVGAGYESDWFSNVGVTSGGAAKVGLALTNQQGAMLPPAWPKRVPHATRESLSTELPDGDAKG
jgi:protocatechuate 3,4-dioxygenase beta subunit